jgi:hypothetical protein
MTDKRPATGPLRHPERSEDEAELDGAQNRQKLFVDPGQQTREALASPYCKNAKT